MKLNPLAERVARRGSEQREHEQAHRFRISRCRGEQGRGLTLHVTPIGFRHIASLMQSRDILIGGEESGGMGFRDHLPERDGLLSALLVLEAVVASGGTLDALLRDLEAEAGPAAYRRRDFTLSPDRGRALVAALDAAPPARIGDRAVTRCETRDGRK